MGKKLKDDPQFRKIAGLDEKEKKEKEEKKKKRKVKLTKKNKKKKQKGVSLGGVYKINAKKGKQSLIDLV